MREVKAVKINAADFAPYGTFYSMTEPEGHPLEVKSINFIQIVFLVPVSEVWHFLRLLSAKMRELLKQRNIIQLHGRELLRWTMT